MLASLSKEEVETFKKIIAKVLVYEGGLSSREERKLRRQLKNKLEELGVPKPSIASELVKIGLYENIEELLPILKHPKGEELIQAVIQLGKMKVNLNTIELSVAKTQKIVYALKSYSHRSAEEEKVPTDIEDNVETVLTIYHNYLKKGVQVIRNYQENLPRIMAYPDELNQVWTNIIHNAIQAMEGKGTLQIDVLQEGNEIVVKITDSGPGIPPEIIDKIFEPFFTTKKAGEGSGLGLDICRRIVQKHGGSISVDSEPGRTTFIVRLPIEPAAEEKTEEKAATS